MGFIGYFVKLIHIPMYVSVATSLCFVLTVLRSNNILVCVSSPRAAESSLMFHTEAAHDVQLCGLLDVTCVLYIRGLFISSSLSPFFCRHHALRPSTKPLHGYDQNGEW